MTTRLLGLDAMREIVEDVGLDALLAETIERLTAACSELDGEHTITMDRTGFHYTKPALGLVEWMPAMELGRLVSIKTVGYHPTNPTERGAPSVLATTSLYDTTDGRLLALSEATFMTALRTGAASAVATNILAPLGASTLGLVGCGAQAVTQAHAISLVRPIDRILASDADASVAASLAGRLRVPIPVEVVDDVSDLLRDSDIICTATSVDIGAPAVLPDGVHRPWLHINAVGADFAGKLELSKSLLDRALVCPDVLGQCLIEGECQQLDPGVIGPDLVDLVSNHSRHEPARDRLTVFDSTGWALEDLVAAEMMSDHADRLGVGVEIDLQPRPTDPYDPYEFLPPAGSS